MQWLRPALRVTARSGGTRVYAPQIGEERIWLSPISSHPESACTGGRRTMTCTTGGNSRFKSQLESQPPSLSLRVSTQARLPFLQYQWPVMRQSKCIITEKYVPSIVCGAGDVDCRQESGAANSGAHTAKCQLSYHSRLHFRSGWVTHQLRRHDYPKHEPTTRKVWEASLDSVDSSSAYGCTKLDGRRRVP